MYISDENGEDADDDISVASNFIIRKAVIKGTTPLYAVPATRDPKSNNWFFQGFGVDYSGFKEPVKIDLDKKLIAAGSARLVYQSDAL